MGIVNKCFEILESKSTDFGHGHHGSGDDGTFGMSAGYQTVDGMSEDEDDEDEEDDDDIDGTGAGTAGDSDETESEGSDADHDDSDDESSDAYESERKGPRLKLREILFYDDKVAIFKARHGRL